MRGYTTIALLTALGFVAGAIFFFLQENDTTAHLYLLFAVVVLIGVFYVLKWLYYLKSSATLNEVSFVLLLPLAPPAQILFKLWIDVQLPLIAELTLTINENVQGVTVDYLDLFCLPYYIITVFFILRTYLRYPFIRLTGYSSKGLPSLLIALLLSAGLPIAYAIVGLLASNALLLFFAPVLLLVGVIGVFV